MLMKKTLQGQHAAEEVPSWELKKQPDDQGPERQPHDVELRKQPDDQGPERQPHDVELGKQPDDQGPERQPHDVELRKQPDDQGRERQPHDVELRKQPDDQGPERQPHDVELRKQPDDQGRERQPHDVELRKQPDDQRPEIQLHDVELEKQPADDLQIGKQSDDLKIGKPQEEANLIPGAHEEQQRSPPVAKLHVFQNAKSPTSHIPKIIHQMWSSSEVPIAFVHWVKGWRQNHPDWEYWFWTPSDMEFLLRKVAPDYLQTYSSYMHDIHRANSLRYYIMYYFGGVYADLDMENLRPLHPWMNHSCVLPLETEAHSIIIHNRKELNVMINLLLCRPNHPYFKLAIENLMTYPGLTPEQRLLYPDEMYRKYKSTPENDPVTLVEPKYFMPTFDFSKIMLIKQICSQGRLTLHQDELCESLDQREYISEPLAMSYTNHHWSHVVENEAYFQFGRMVSIHDVVENVTNVTKMIELLDIG